MESLVENRLAIFNEVMVSAYIYLMLPLTDFNTVANKDIYGTLIIATIFTSILVNFIKALMTLGKELMHKYFSKLRIKSKKYVKEEPK